MIKRLMRKARKAYRRLQRPPVEERDFFLPAAPVPATGPLLKGRVALVTGAGPDIGGHTARELARHGATVYFTELNEDWRRELERDLKAINPLCRGFLADVATADDSHQVLEIIGSQGHPVDILVNNAVRYEPSCRFEDRNIPDIAEAYGVNLFGPLLLTQLVVKRLIAAGRPGSMLFMTSIHQWVLGRPWLGYTTAKAALGMTVRELAMDLARHRIRVNGIAPGYCHTGKNPHLRPCRLTPLGRGPVHPRYIGRAAVMLAADFFSLHTTGAVLTVDGGLSLHSYLSRMEMEG